MGIIRNMNFIKEEYNINKNDLDVTKYMRITNSLDPVQVVMTVHCQHPYRDILTFLSYFFLII